MWGRFITAKIEIYYLKNLLILCKVIFKMHIVGKYYNNIWFMVYISISRFSEIIFLPFTYLRFKKIFS